MTFITRFAPSPTGPLHLGHAYSAMLGHDMATRRGGLFLLRIEDIDLSRARPDWEAGIFDDLSWLGLSWPRPVMRQSDRFAVYDAALDALWARGLVYPCTCSRRDIEAAASAPQEGAPLLGPDGVIYPGTCRPATPVPSGPRPRNVALRLNMVRAVQDTALPFAFAETGHGPEGETGTITADGQSLIDGVGDIVLARRDMGTSYHLSVVLDDADQGITHVVRGQDLFGATMIHVVLQRLLGIDTPVYHHHRLIRDETGKRLAKRDDARAIRTYRAEGASPADIRRMVGP
ncbi:tRNA glutamyl-Q(34) synthetase GluQRS [Sedimentitalea sp. JM2-8]|uniref:tRNA glutamyl-Q(34) synthetase GluQRS n=1 Tax=Sedimentitalea xiamensis TaxID=3050037 RepID=A0ABT7FG41_9RHOB|nr:tRNA glutamyl-Q(34) synthetase GluQRS [Sedimentitalea xiamensis]MDK3074111.1 tRNA glutamyl-Q(34) synthetase GluQRS [Sedimentitalea xiamensis]